MATTVRSTGHIAESVGGYSLPLPLNVETLSLMVEIILASPLRAIKRRKPVPVSVSD